jgi:hypothetical protein
MWTVRQIRTLRALSYILAQLVGAAAAYWLYVYFIKTDLQPITGPAYDPRIMAAEATGAFLLAMAYAAAVFNGYLSTKRGAIVGAAYALAIMLAASATIGIINPAVGFSMRAITVTSLTGWGTYVLGPILGAIIGFNLYALLFAEESALLRVRSVVSARLGRSQATASAAAPAAPAAPARRRGRPATKRSATTARRTSGTRRTTRSSTARSRR